MSDSNPSKRGPIRFLFENSLFLIAGALAALIWANVDADSYHDFVHFNLINPSEGHGGHGGESKHKGDKSHKDEAHKDEATEDDSHKEDEGKDESDKDESHKDEAHKDEAHKDDSDKEDEGKDQPSDAEEGDEHWLTVHFLINDMLMAFFFAIAGKEVWESLLPGGALSNPRRAATPLMATLGGVIGPAVVYLAGAYFCDRWDLSRGWAIPCATDIAFSYLIARLVFGSGHPAIAFLLLLAIADDALGLVILAVAYPSKPIVYSWLLLSVGSIVLGMLFRKLRLTNFWWYLLIPGALCWLSFYKAGLHPALGLVPIIPTMPNAHTDLGIFARKEKHRRDTLNEFEHTLKNPVEIVLGLFGLVNAGVTFNAVGVGTWIVLAGLLVGKPVGITLFTWFSEAIFGLEIPAGMGYRHIVTLGMIAAIGFTVALFVSTAAFQVPPFPAAVQDSVKMGALLSLLAAVLAVLLARVLGIKPLQD